MSEPTRLEPAHWQENPPAPGRENQLQRLAELHPELTHWPRGALASAWAQFSHQDASIAWKPVARRNVGFLEMLCRRQLNLELPAPQLRASDRFPGLAQAIELQVEGGENSRPWAGERSSSERMPDPWPAHARAGLQVSLIANFLPVEGRIEEEAEGAFRVSYRLPGGSELDAWLDLEGREASGKLMALHVIDPQALGRYGVMGNIETNRGWAWATPRWLAKPATGQRVWIDGRGEREVEDARLIDWNGAEEVLALVVR